MSKPSRVLFVCRDCSRRSDGPDLRKYVKKRLKEDGLHKDVRVVKTDCMGLCPEDDLVCIAPPRKDCEAVDPKRDREAVYERLVDGLG